MKTVFVDSAERARSASQQKPTVFVDRDGTLNVDQVRQVDVAKLVLMPGAAEAIRLWNSAGWRVVVVTNQSGLGRGLYTEADMHAFHRALVERLGGGVEAFYWCPHLPDAGCACRKPGTALFERAAKERGIDLRASFVVGDSWMDVGAGQAIGARTVLVPSKADALAACAKAPDHVARDLADAARWTLGQP